MSFSSDFIITVKWKKNDKTITLQIDSQSIVKRKNQI